MDEFELITRCFRDRAPRRPDTVLGIGDDAALLDTGGLPLVHVWATAAFSIGDDAAGVARYVFAAALLRLAARAVMPRWTTLGLTLEAAEPGWLEPFSTAATAVCEASGVELVGGDTTRGPGRATVFALGAGPVLPSRPEPRTAAATPSPDRTLQPGGGSGGPEPGLASITPRHPRRSARLAEPGFASPPPHHPRRSARRAEPGLADAAASAAAPAPAFTLRLSPVTVDAPERTIAALVSACADLAGRGIEIHWSDAPCTEGDTRVPNLVAHTDAAGAAALRAAADPRRLAVASPDAADA